MRLFGERPRWISNELSAEADGRATDVQVDVSENRGLLYPGFQAPRAVGARGVESEDVSVVRLVCQ